MKTKFLSIILALFIVQPCVCLADAASSSSIDSASSMPVDSSSSIPVENFEKFEIKTENLLEDGTSQNLTSDFLHFFTNKYTLSKGKKISALDNCIFKNIGDQYDRAGALFTIDCGEDSDFRAYVTTETDLDGAKIKSDFGGITFVVPNANEKFNIFLKAKKDAECELSAFGVGVNKTAKEGFPLELNCPPSSGSHLSIAKALVGAIITLLALF